MWVPDGAHGGLDKIKGGFSGTPADGEGGREDPVVVVGKWGRFPGRRGREVVVRKTSY